MINFTTEQLEAKVREIAAARPDVRYYGAALQCSYWEGECSDGTTGCLIGQAAKALGAHSCNFPEGAIWGVLKDMGLAPSTFLARVQIAQDQNLPWGQVVENASYLCGGPSKYKEGQDEGWA